MKSLIREIEDEQKKAQVVEVRSGDTVRVHQRIQEGAKERVQVFEGLVIRTKRAQSLTSSITVRRIASGIGVEKTFLLHSPLIVKVEITKRSDVNRNYLTYMRKRSGKSARLEAVEFDQEQVNRVDEPASEEVVVEPAAQSTNEDVAADTEVTTDVTDSADTADKK